MTAAKPRIVYWNSIPAPIMIGRFNAIAKRGNLEFEAWFSEESSSIRSWIVNEEEWLFPAQYVPLMSWRGRGLRMPLASLKQRQPDVFVSLFANPSFIAGHLSASTHARRTAFRLLPTFDTWIKRTRIREVTKHALFRNVDAVKVPGPDGAAQAMRYGVPNDRIFPVTQSVDVDFYRKGSNISSDKRAQMRSRLGVDGFVFLYIGRIWKQKGLDYLLQAFAKIRRSRNDVFLILIGDGVDEEFYKAKWKMQPGLVFTGFIQTPDIPVYMAVADAFVFPTLGDPNGLVVEEAMASALPVIATASAGDIALRVREGQTGFIVPPASANDLALRMNSLLENPKEARRMGLAGQEYASGKSHERYAMDFESFVDGVLSQPPRSNPLTFVTQKVGRIIPLQPAT